MLQSFLAPIAALAFASTLAVSALAQSPDPGPESLKAKAAELRDAITAGERLKVARITSEFLPDEDQLVYALAPDLDEARREKALDFHRNIARDDDTMASLMPVKPGQTEIQVHASTVEELGPYTEGTVAFEEFPTGASDLAVAGVLNPALTFYEVEFLEPGKDAGMKYHLFYWNGGSWSMLGPVWRALE
jgi:hypothetical protein